MNLQPQIQELDTLAASLTKAASIREKVKLADMIFETLADCERLVEKFVTTELGAINGAGSKQAPLTVQHSARTDDRQLTSQFKNLKLADIARMLLKERGVLHGTQIEELAKEGGYKSESEHFQSYLATALKREGDFENLGRNRWKLKEGNKETQIA